MNNKKLYRSVENRKLLGICGGIADYFDIDATIVRVLFLLLAIFSAGFPVLLFYIICAFIIPEEPKYFDTEYSEKKQ